MRKQRVKVFDRAAGERACRRRASRAQRGSNAIADTRVPGKGASRLYMIPLKRWNLERSCTFRGKIIKKHGSAHCLITPNRQMEHGERFEVPPTLQMSGTRCKGGRTLSTTLAHHGKWRHQVKWRHHGEAKKEVPLWITSSSFTSKWLLEHGS